jgi:hypothetical protein
LVALRQLLAADIALARAAVLRALAWAGLAVVFAGSAWLLLLVALVCAAQAAGLAWPWAALLVAILSLGAAVAAAAAVRYYLAHAGLQASRRQLASLQQEVLEALGGVLRRAAAAPDPDPASAAQTGTPAPGKAEAAAPESSP